MGAITKEYNEGKSHYALEIESSKHYTDTLQMDFGYETRNLLEIIVIRGKNKHGFQSHIGMAEIKLNRAEITALKEYLETILNLDEVK